MYKSALRIGDKSNRVLVRTDELRPIKEVFSTNWERIGGLVLFPAWIGQFSQEHTVAARMAEHEIVGKWFPTPDEVGDRYDQVSERATQIMMSATPADISAIQDRFALTLNNIDMFVRIGGEPCASGASVIFDAMIVQAWTVFEVMAGDLWEAALNSHPQTLAGLGGKMWTSAADSLPKKEEESKKMVALYLLETNNFDLSGKMGTILKGKCKFDSVWAIRESYAKAFSKRFDDIKAALMDDCVINLAAVRNVIVHKAGKVDQKSLDEARDCDELKGLKPGDSLNVNGESVSNLVRPVFKRAIDLICAVDKWIFESRNKTSRSETAAE
jgi:hypothetical protein